MTLTDAAQFLIREATRFVSPVPVASEWVLAAFAGLFAAVIPLSWLRVPRDAFVSLANRQRVSILICGLIPVAVRLALLPWMPVPDPSIHDEFSHLLLADTLAHGRLANPTHPMWRHFETIHVLQKPTYSSMYPPGQDVLLALGEVVFHQPWAGVVIGAGFMCASICWAMQGWLPPSWALFGTLLAILKIGVPGLWMNSFLGGSVSAVAGALLLGAVARLRKGNASPALGMLAGFALVLLMNTRPFEGALLAAVALFYTWPAFFRNPRQLLLPAATVLACGALFTGYYDFRVTGNPVRMAYQVNRDTYGWPENLAFLPLKQPRIDNPVLRNMYLKEAAHRTIYNSIETLLDNLTVRLFENWIVIVGPLLSIPLVYLTGVFRDRATRPLILFVAAIAGLNLFQMVLYPFHLSPVLPAVYMIVAAGLIHMPARRIAFATALPLCLILTGAMKQDAKALDLDLSYWEAPAEPHGESRAEITEWLSRRPGKHLVVVHYEPWHDPDQEWVYNGADIDGSRIVWAQSLNPSADRELIRYFRDREIWLLNADTRVPHVVVYQGEK